ncbi:MAG: hypothetical protein M3Q71_15410 [Chloroflexota bacterium]|nr:hypothetical protein [Chloroflexota bacterium]
MSHDLQADETAAIETARVAADPPGGSETAFRQGDLVALVGTTTRLYEECLLPNGALVEAPTHLPFYPAGARDAFRCRPGTLVSFAISAMDALGRDVRAPLLRWIRDRAAGFADDGLLRHAYAVHGPVLDTAHDVLGSGLLLWAINARPQRAESDVAQEVTRGVASALAVRWDGNWFRDHPATEGAFRAAELAAAELGLRAASTAVGIQEWMRVADALRQRRDEAIETLPDPAGTPTPEDRDRLVEAHLALAWPCSNNPGMPRERLVDLAERAVGLHNRAPVADSGDDASPLHLTGLQPAELFWLATARAAVNDPGNAAGYYDLGLSLADTDGHFPEASGHQALEPSPKPVLFAHLLFLQAADALGALATIPKSGYTGRRRPV